MVERHLVSSGPEKSSSLCLSAAEPAARRNVNESQANAIHSKRSTLRSANTRNGEFLCFQ